MSEDNDDQAPPPPWDDHLAQSMIGATVLIGITRVDPAGTTLEQMFGTIMEAQAGVGFTIRLDGARAGEIYHLPPHLQSFHPARPGEYRLRSTGEVVRDPDYTTSWTIHPRKQ